jgi:glycerophosphoryl diester phosphodiesterase
VDVVAHRGLTHCQAENSLAALSAALAAGLDRVEVDVRAASDGGLFLLHDPSLERTTNAAGRLACLSSRIAETVQLYDGSMLPRLADALLLCRRRAVLCLDIKEERAVDPLVSLLSRFDAAAEVWSEHRSVVRRAAAAGISTALISSGLLAHGPGEFLWAARDAGASSVSFYPADLEPYVAAACRNASMPFLCGTPNDEATWRYLLQEGARGIITDRPLECRRMLSLPQDLHCQREGRSVAVRAGNYGP